MPIDQDQAAYMACTEFVFSLRLPGGYDSERIVRELLEETRLNTKSAEVI